MNRYTPVKTKMDNEDNYNSPYDDHNMEDDALYEAPTCLKRNPSGSLFIPSGSPNSPGESTLPLESRIKHSAYSPHHTLREYSPHEESSSSRAGNLYTNSSSVYNVGSLGTRLGNTLLSRGGVGGGAGGSPARSPNTDKYSNNLDNTRSTLPNYGSSGHLTVYHPSTHPLHNGKPQNSSSQSSQSFRLKSDFQSRCSWKFIAIFFMLFSFLLVSALIYTAASNYIIRSGASNLLEKAQACAVIEDDNNNNNNINHQDQGASGYELSEAPAVSIPPDASSFKELPLGVKLAQLLSPYKFWNFKLQQSSSAYINFDFNIPKGASIGLYARRNALPSITNNDIRDVLRGFREKRSVSMPKSLSYYFEGGHWFISLYNDDNEPRQVELTAHVSHDLTSGCPKGCGGHGDCMSGVCVCHQGFVGLDCTQSTCPVLCSSNGEYVDGGCHCFPGWKGAECSIRHDECEVADCNNQGECENGECVCSSGFTGQFCEKVDCPDPLCSGRGKCIHGECHCAPGWKGPACQQKDNIQVCPQSCSVHGVYDVQLGVCRCNQGYYGVDCSKERCHLDCGEHGECENGQCACALGWSGLRCTVRECDARCSAHGMCANGTCLCTNGWNGKHCTLEGCPGNCNGHGSCTTTYELEWECICETGWYGPACDIQLEDNCDDKIDNDKDGLVDCEDPECCENPVCERSQLCHTVSSPIDILLRKQPPAMTAPFYERMRFIIEENGLQSYAKKIGFNESRAAVVRGQVITPSGMGLIGVRVSTNGVNEGFTMTRDDGWFDLMVNGGGPVILQFGRNPYSPLRLSLYVPWNEVMVLSPVQLGRQEVYATLPELYSRIPTCTQHDYTRMVPIILSTWLSNYRSTTGSGILKESRVVRETLALPGSNVRLVYISSRAKGFYSIIQLQLTPDHLPQGLVRVHLVISIEGVLEEKIFEADPNIQYTFAWDRLNVYRQRVYGVTTANVKVGYEYTGCSLVWIAKTTRVAGHDMVLSDIGGWNLDVMHKYNYHEGILQKGDGTNVYLKYTPLVVTTLMGNGQPRDLNCGGGGGCEGRSRELSLLAPKSLASGPDGSIFLADHNLIRRIRPDGTVNTLLRLNSTRVEYRYFLAHRPFGLDQAHRQALYVALPDLYTVLRVKDINNPTDVDSNWAVAFGSGERCIPGDPALCGDGGKAEFAKLTYPKGLAVGPDGKVYIADGTNIRMVDDVGIIHTLVGHQAPRSTWRPLPCSGAILAAEVQLNWPTDMAINPLDGTLHFIDDGLVLRLTNDGRIQVVAGRPLHCHPGGKEQEGFLPHTTALLEPQSISFSDQGELYVAESDSKRINRVRRIVNNKIDTVAGKNSNCNCLDAGCRCYDPESYLAASTRFSSISSIAVSPDGRLVVADQGNLRIRTVASFMPTREDEEVFEVPDPESQELYVFNRFGQHVLTKDLLTQALIYSMDYSQITSTGKLVSITDSDGRKLVVLRDYSQQVTALQTADGQKHVVKVNRMGYLESFSTPDGYKANFNYAASTGLLETKLDSQNYGYIFKYDQYGRLIESVSPTGEITFLTFNLTLHGGNIKVGESVLSVNDNKVTETSLAGDVIKETSVQHDKTLEVAVRDRTLTLVTITHPVIRHRHPVIGDSYPMIGGLRVEAGSNLVSKVDWEYGIQTSGHDTQLLGINKKLRVNGENLLFVSYDKLQRREVLYLPDKTELLQIKYDEYSRPITWATPSGVWTPVSQKYDRFGHLEVWRRGEIFEKYSYDKNGRLTDVRDGTGSILTYEYTERDTNPHAIKTGNGASYLLDYDAASGAVRSLTTPRGHIHAWNIQPDISKIKWSYISPWSLSPYTVIFNVHGDIQSVKYPGNDQVSYIYTNSGELQSIFAGATEIEFSLEAESKYIESIFINQAGLECREKRKYHNGWLKEQRIRFGGGNSPFDNAFIKYQMDGTGRPAKVVFQSGSKREHSAPELAWSYDQKAGTLLAVDRFQIRNFGFNTTQIQDVNFRKTILRDGYGNFKRIAYTVKGQPILAFTYEYNSENQLLAHATTVDEEGRESRESYSYNDNRQLDKSWGIANFDFNYDENGNMIMVSADSGRDVVIYGPGDRVESHGTKKIVYDANGFVTAIDEQRFLFNGLGNLVRYVSERGIKVQYFYDAHNRLVGWTDSLKNSAQYFYTNPLDTNQLTFVINKNRPTQKLIYDTNGHLIQIESLEEMLYVACDQFGSPLLVFRAGGNIVKRLRYSPFGAVLEDTNPNIHLPIGFRGQITSRHAKFLMKEGRVYSTAIIQWLNPDWAAFFQEVRNPFDIFIYRYHNNNPMRASKEPGYMTSMHDWTKAYGFDVDSIFHATKPVGGLMKPEPHHRIKLDSLLPSQKLLSETDSLVDTAIRDLKQVSFVNWGTKALDAHHRRVNLLPRFTSSPQNLGRGFLLSVVEDSVAVVNPIEVQNSVVQSIFESVLNNSVYLDTSFSDSSKSVYYFVKSNMNKFSLDSDTVRRLAGEFTVSNKEIENGKELSIVNARFEVRILYGSAPGVYRAQLLQTFAGLAVSRAWLREKEAVGRGFNGDWSPSEISELLRTGSVKGYEVVEIQPSEKFPELALDPTNREFIKFGQRNRKNRHSRRKHSQD